MQSPHSHSPTPPAIPWYAQTWFTVLMLFLFPPVGCFLLWKYRSWNPGVKVVVTILSLGFLMVASLSDQADKKSNQATAQKADATRVAATSPKTQPSTANSAPQKKPAVAKPAAAKTPASKTVAKKAAATDSAAATTEEDSMASNVQVVNIEGLGKREVGVVDDVHYIISEIEVMKSIGSQMGSTDADGMFYVVRMAAQNTDRKTHDVNTSGIKLLDDQDREFDPSTDGSSALMMTGDKTAEVFLTQVQPGVTKRITLVFDAPEGAKGLKIKIPAGSFSLGKDAIIKVP